MSDVNYICVPCRVIVYSDDKTGMFDTIEYAINYPLNKGLINVIDNNVEILLITNNHLIESYIKSEMFFGISANIKNRVVSLLDNERVRLLYIEVEITDKNYKIFSRKNKIRTLLLTK